MADGDEIEHGGPDGNSRTPQTGGSVCAGASAGGGSAPGGEEDGGGAGGMRFRGRRFL